MTTDLEAFAGLTLEQIDRILRAAEVQQSLAEYTKDVFPVEHGERELIWGRHLDAVCAHLEAVSRGVFNRLIINIPPGMMKSLLTSVYWPSWEWAREATADRGFLCVSSTPDVAVRDSRRMRETVQSEWYQRTFSPTWQFTRTQNTKTSYLTTAGGYRISRSTGAKMTGLRGDCIVFDDPLDAREAIGASDRVQTVNDWFEAVLFNRRNHPSDPVVIIMQRLHDNDLTGYLERKGGWTILRLPMEFEPEHKCVTPIWEDWRTEPGELLLPEMFTPDEIAELRRSLGSMQYAAQYQQRPAPEGGAVFKREWFQQWTESDRPHTFDLVWASWDMTFKKSKDSHYVVGQCWGRVGDRLYLLDQIRAKMDLPDVKAAVSRSADRWRDTFGRIDAILVENTANGPAVVESLATDWPIIPIDPQGNSKQSRAHAAAVTTEAGKIYIPNPEDHRWVTSEFLPEMLSFPVATHDDIVDAYAQAVVWSNAHNPEIFVFKLC